LIVAVVNATETEQTLELDLSNFRSAGTGKTWSLKAADLDAQNVVGKAPGVVIAEGTFDTATKVMKVPPTSIQLFEYSAA
jgi:alpha-L-arabinofuranosidase